ncbi:MULTISPECIES: fumarate hydratase [Aminobacterium]|uniref:fumarate hydratase n=1 Tax=Aminobacterium TaxID=81466 RepID=UPI000A9DFEC8|nr:fumarate hydratase [Aminobacterium sp. EBM-42]MDD2379944.1 fumarate hydratase [Aminobacterium colombiense]MDD4266339.1 fumarate hydratase [Aminobacterium colombiense]
MVRYPNLYQDVYDMIYSSTTSISSDVKEMMQAALERETNDTAKSMMQAMLDDAKMAGEKVKPLCQSPGFPTIYVSFGDKSSPREDIKKIWADALVEGTKNHLLRPSMVDTLTRENPGDNSGVGVPNFEFDYCPDQEYLDMLLSFKGCGAELANAMKIFTVAQLEKDKDFAGLKRWVLDTVIKGGGKPCPPGAIGIGLGGQMDVACKLARKAVSTRRWNDVHPDPRYAALEKELLENINSLGLGAAGTGGDTTLLAVKIAAVSTHTAIAPAAISFHCWAARRTHVRLYPDGRKEILL